MPDSAKSGMSPFFVVACFDELEASGFRAIRGAAFLRRRGVRPLGGRCRIVARATGPVPGILRHARRLRTGRRRRTLPHAAARGGPFVQLPTVFRDQTPGRIAHLRPRWIERSGFSVGRPACLHPPAGRCVAGHVAGPHGRGRQRCGDVLRLSPVADPRQPNWPDTTRTCSSSTEATTNSSNAASTRGSWSVRRNSMRFERCFIARGSIR